MNITLSSTQRTKPLPQRAYEFLQKSADALEGILRGEKVRKKVKVRTGVSNVGMSEMKTVPNGELERLCFV